MKNTILKTLILGTVLIFSVSCYNEQDTSELVDPSEYPIATFEIIGDTHINEQGGAIIQVKITFDKQVKGFVNFDAIQIGGTATLHEDYDIENTSVLGYSNEAVLNIIIHEDTDPEELETLELEITTPNPFNSSVINPSSVLPTIEITIDNYVADAIDMSFDWEKDIDYAGSTYHACGNIDLDIYVANAEGYDNNDPWANANFTGFAATGDCPELLTMDMATWADGEYILFHDLWANEFTGLGTNTSVPITATFNRAGAFEIVVEQDASQAINSDMIASDTNNIGHNGFIAKVKIENGLFTISDFNGTDLISGKSNSSKNKTTRPNWLRN